MLDNKKALYKFRHFVCWYAWKNSKGNQLFKTIFRFGQWMWTRFSTFVLMLLPKHAQPILSGGSNAATAFSRTFKSCNLLQASCFIFLKWCHCMWYLCIKKGPLVTSFFIFLIMIKMMWLDILAPIATHMGGFWIHLVGRLNHAEWPNWNQFLACRYPLIKKRAISDLYTFKECVRFQAV